MRDKVAIDPAHTRQTAWTGRQWHFGSAGPPLVLAAVTLVLLFGWAAMPWQWSLVDDPDYKLNLMLAQQESGWLGGMLERVDAGYAYDRAGGQFRPLLWVYSATFYLLGPGPAHAARLLLLLLAIGSVGLAVRARLLGAVPPGLALGVCLWAIAALASIRGLFDGLSFLSIMELPTVAFAAAAAADRSDARRVLWLTLASLCKTPVVGGLFALALVLYRRGRRGLALAAACIGLVIILWAREFALGGSYTADYQLTVEHARSTLIGLGRQLALPLVVLACALPWVRTWRPRFDADGFVLITAGLGYIVLLLPWGSSSGYNLAAPAFLLVAGAVLTVTGPGRERSARQGLDTDGTAAPPLTEAPPRRSLMIGPLVVALAIAGLVAVIGVKAAVDRDSTIRGVVDWADQLPEKDVVATNGIESAVRYAQILALRHGGTSSRQFVYAQPGTVPPCGVDWLVAMHDQGRPESESGLELARSLPLGDVYRVVESGGQEPAC